ncbi:MAG: ferrous iron transport protein B [Anaerolineales bacterium]|nr:ferrous iron transport protein B [Anaerolineales bacterium]
MSCHTGTQTLKESRSSPEGNGANSAALDKRLTIALVGHPNVGKSVMFQRLTGQFVTVSNYPGTTVEISRGKARTIPDADVVDTPGVMAFPSITEDEQVTARLLLEEPLKAVVQVGDAKNLRRTLLLAVQIAEMGFPYLLALNMMDEARAKGVVINHQILAEHLDCTVIPTTATRGQGLDELSAAVSTLERCSFRLRYPVEVEVAVTEVSKHLPPAEISARALAVLWLSGDPVSQEWLQGKMSADGFEQIQALRESLQMKFVDSLTVVIQHIRLEYVEQLTSAAVSHSEGNGGGLTAKLSRLTTHPIWGVAILAAVLSAVYWFVGVFGAGVLVDLLEENLFGELINPWVSALVADIIPLQIGVDFLVGDYGLWTMGITYAFALILPIVVTFFLAFGIMEDSGYLPRLAALSNRMFKLMGLNGKAVLPMVLGLGCVTMATLTTRILESKRERLLVILLLALAVPCSAQLGVVMGMLAGISFQAALIWSAVVLLVLLGVGWLAAQLVPGERTMLLVDLPPLRWPLPSNVLAKTLARLEWYLKEVLPLFLLGAALMFALDRTGLLAWLIHAGEPLMVNWLGLPAETSAAFVMGFLRRDFGATGLFLMGSQGLLSGVQVVVAMVTITLFIPCVATVFMIARERSWQTSLAMILVVIPLAFLVGGLLSRLLMVLGWSL